MKAKVYFFGLGQRIAQENPKYCMADRLLYWGLLEKHFRLLPFWALNEIVEGAYAYWQTLDPILGRFE